MQRVAPHARPAQRHVRAALIAALFLHGIAGAAMLRLWTDEAAPAPPAEAIIIAVALAEAAPAARTQDAGQDAPAAAAEPGGAAPVLEVDAAALLARLSSTAARAIPASPLAAPDTSAASPEARALAATLARCREAEDRLATDCAEAVMTLETPSLTLALWGGDPRFTLGPDFAGLTIPEVRARLGARPLGEIVQEDPLSSAIDHRESSISRLRDRLPPSAPDPAFGD